VTSAFLPFTTVVVAGYVALLALRFRRAPTLPGQGWFASVALTGAFFCGCNVFTYDSGSSDLAGYIASRLQYLASALHVGAWLHFSGRALGRPGRFDRPLAGALAVLGLAALVPGVALRPEVVRHAFPPLGFVYRDFVTTRFGDLLLAAILGGLVTVLLRYVGAWRRGVPQAGLQAAALAALLLMGGNDALVLGGAYVGPYLLDVGFLLPVAAVGWSLGARLVEDASSLDQLRRSLEQQVADRTAALTRAQASLLRAEKLAALGQLAAGVAHEVNNPTAVAAANLAYLEERLVGGGPPPDDALETVRESRVAVGRIARIVRQLLDTSRLASGAERSSRPFRLADGCRAALTTARPRLGATEVQASLDEELIVQGDEQGLVQVVANLLVNAAQSAPDARSVRVRLEARAAGERAEVLVSDDGAGMDAETLRRVFEPFFTTKPFGVGTGLGLAVSRGLLQRMGGELTLASAPDVGTTATITLRTTLELTASSASPRPAARVARRRLLLIDDDDGLRVAMRRALEGRYELELAEGVEAGLAAVRRGQPFDLVLCDVMMPGGGAEAFVAGLDAARPDLSGRLVFLTGGATAEAARAFLARDGRLVLGKPLDFEVLGGLLDEQAAETADREATPVASPS
jgi:signal transduction histidine kinase/CheY-like chemotaxis protein